MFLTIIIFILLLGLLVLVHEWGHFFAARMFGVRVEEFAFGFPPRLASYVRGGTRFALNLFPLGGYVKIFGESGGGEDDPESFSSRSPVERTLIIAAGVVMNLVLAWALFSLGHGLGLPTVLDEEQGAQSARVTIIAVAPQSPAEEVGLRFGDAIREFKIQDAKFEIRSVDEVQKFIDQHRGEKISVVVLRGTQTAEIEVIPRREPPSGQGPLGIALARVGVVRSPWWRAPWDGLKTTASVVVAIVRALGDTVAGFVRGEISADVSGPVGIFVFANETRRLGLAYLIELAGILSVNLALLNILPIPALDGGRILFIFIEKIRGIRVNQRLEQAVHTIGFFILLALMALITYRDVVRFF